MFKFNNITRTFRNHDNGQGNQSPAFSTGSSPFQQAGGNIFESMKKNNANPSDTTQDMAAPNMTNGMPASAGQLPNNVVQGQQQPSNIVPNTPAYNQTGGQQQGGSPLDIYAQKPDNVNQGGQQQQAPATTPQTPQQQEASKSIFDTDMKGWEGAMKNVDLVAGIEPENVQKALAGDANMFMDIIQQVSRTAMHNAAFMSTKVAGSGFNTNMENFSKTIPDMINNHQYNTMWQGDAVMNHESAQPMVQALTTQLRGQFPQATPQEIQQHVQQYFKTFSESMTGQQQQADKTQEAEVTTSDIGNFFNNSQ
jgi:hypothetical protein